MRPIDADVVQEHLNELMNNEYCDPDFKKACFGLSVYLDDVPTLEVEPVKHGKWIRYNGENICSECHRCNFTMTFYCPHCGAKMEGDDENE